MGVNVLGGIYDFMDTTTDHFTPLPLRVRGNDTNYSRCSKNIEWVWFWSLLARGDFCVGSVRRGHR